eukprot:1493589-Prymnesium_polylepis.1
MAAAASTVPMWIWAWQKEGTRPHLMSGGVRSSAVVGSARLFCAHIAADGCAPRGRARRVTPLLHVACASIDVRWATVHHTPRHSVSATSRQLIGLKQPPGERRADQCAVRNTLPCGAVLADPDVLHTDKGRDPTWPLVRSP